MKIFYRVPAAFFHHGIKVRVQIRKVFNFLWVCRQIGVNNQRKRNRLCILTIGRHINRESVWKRETASSVRFLCHGILLRCGLSRFL